MVTPGTWWSLLAHCWDLKHTLPFSAFLHGFGRIKLRASHGVKQVLNQLNHLLSSEASISEEETMNYLLEQLLKTAFLTNLFHSVLLGQKSRFPLPPLEERPLTFPLPFIHLHTASSIVTVVESNSLSCSPHEELPAVCMQLSAEADQGSWGCRALGALH